MKKILIIAGATASGKSGLAVRLAKKFNGEVISCDSMQIYRHFDVGTAKITREAAQGVKHHMIDVVDPSEEYSVWEYSSAAKEVIDDVSARGKLPIIAGGTGLYIESLIYPLNFAVNKDEEVRARLKKELETLGAQALHARLAQADPEDAAKIHPNNTKRLIRALEILEITGGAKPKEELRAPQYDVCLVVVDVPRDELYRRINERVEQMFASGLEAEIRDILAKGLADRNSQSMQAIGYKEFFDFFDGKCGIEKVKENIKQNTRRYAKRQLSWLRRYDFAHWVACDDTDTVQNIVNDFLKDKR